MQSTMTRLAPDNWIQVAVYNLRAQKLTRTIAADMGRYDSSQVLDYGMSGGVNKLLFVIWGPTDPTLTVYRWYSGKVLGSVRHCGVIRAAFEPATDTILAITPSAIMTFTLAQASLHKSTLSETLDVRYFRMFYRGKMAIRDIRVLHG